MNFLSEIGIKVISITTRVLLLLQVTNSFMFQSVTGKQFWSPSQFPIERAFDFSSLKQDYNMNIFQYHLSYLLAKSILYL